MATKKTTKTPAKKATKKARRKNPTDAQKRAWKKLGLLAKRRAAEARRKNGTKKPRRRNPAAKKAAVKKAVARKPAAKKAAVKKAAPVARKPAVKKAASRRKTITPKPARKATKRTTSVRISTAAYKPTASFLERRRNPGELYKLFTGETSDSFELVTAPAGTPANIDQLGDFVEFKWMDAEGHRYTVNLEGQGIHCKLAASRNRDGYDQLYVVSTENGDLPNFGAYLPEGDVGYIYEITYRARKAHLGDAQPKLYYHRLGEETGRPPILRIDHEGYLHFKDGEYWIEDRGIVN